LYQISKDFTFAAAHRLDGLDDGHKCARFHGHNYLVRLEISAVAADGLGDPGFVIDYGDLVPFGAWLDATFDHQWLGAGNVALTSDDNTLAQVTKPAVEFNPTAENLAHYLLEWVATPGNIPGLSGLLHASPWPVTLAVGVSETPKTWAWAR
jgi:6-pyruvoyltetrahydropterin/6-carboxytetrahydropterin synthase